MFTYYWGASTPPAKPTDFLQKLLVPLLPLGIIQGPWPWRTSTATVFWISPLPTKVTIPSLLSGEVPTVHLLSVPARPSSRRIPPRLRRHHQSRYRAPHRGTANQ